MKSSIPVRGVFIVTFFLIGSHVVAQRKPSSGLTKEVPPSDKPWTPGSSPEQKSESKREKEPQRPLTKKELRRKLRQDERQQKKDYSNFHDAVQTKKVRKRMKKNAKISAGNNANKRPSIWRRIAIKFRKKSRLKSK